MNHVNFSNPFALIVFTFLYIQFRQNFIIYFFVCFVSNDDVNSMVIFYATGLFQFDTVITHIDLKTDCRITDITGFPIPCILVDA